MKKINLTGVFLSLLFFQAIAQEHDFKYQGDFPEDHFIIVKITDQGIDYLEGDSIALRNRVYLMIDTLGLVTLNNHPLGIEKLKEGIKYAITNPNQLPHLPSALEEAVIFTNIAEVQTLDRTDTVALFKRQLIMGTIQDIYRDLLLHYLVEELNREWATMASRDVQLLLEKFPLTIARPNEFEQDILAIPEPEPQIEDSKSRNYLKVLVNDKNEVFVRDQQVEITEVKALAKAFIQNPEGDDSLAESPKKAIISLKNFRGTRYDVYLKVYNALRDAYQELWEEYAQSTFGKPYEALSSEEKTKVKKEIPFMISEGVPMD